MNKILKFILIVLATLLGFAVLLHVTVLLGANYEGVFIIDNIHDLVHGAD